VLTQRKPRQRRLDEDLLKLANVQNGDRCVRICAAIAPVNKAGYLRGAAYRADLMHGLSWR